MDVKQLASLMEVSEQDAESFVVGVSLQVNKGLSLVDAIKAHQKLWGQAFEASAAALSRPRGSELARSFVVDAFFPAGA